MDLGARSRSLVCLHKVVESHWIRWILAPRERMESASLRHLLRRILSAQLVCCRCNFCISFFGGLQISEEEKAEPGRSLHAMRLRPPRHAQSMSRMRNDSSAETHTINTVDWHITAVIASSAMYVASRAANDQRDSSNPIGIISSGNMNIHTRDVSH
jgi:hypothetical protein